MKRKWPLVALLLVLVLGGQVYRTPAAGQPAVGLPAAAVKEAALADPGDPADLAAFFEAFVPAQLAQRHLPGAVVAVVHGGKLVYSRGFGYADLEQRIGMSPEHTVLRVASISKLFTATAVMQLVEARKLDLHADVNGYLGGLRIPATYPQPVTLAHLLTHTPGFEERTIGVNHARTQAERLPLAEYVAKALPARVRPPGQLVGYANYSTDLAGCIVERAAGQPFEDYIEEHIFAPLGMAHSSFRQPPALAAGDHLALGYTYQDGRYAAGDFEWMHGAPAAGLSTTAHDMAAFMIAHLQEGRYGQQRILRAETARDMQRRHFTHDPRLAGWGYGFQEMLRNGRRLIGHKGALNYFHSLTALLPQEGMGLFVAYNSAEGEEAHRELLEAFLDRFFPSPAAAAPPVAPAEIEGKMQAGQFAGYYRPTRSAYTTLEKLGNLIYPEIVTADAAGRLQFDGEEWVAVAPLLFRQVDGDDILLFRADENGGITQMFRGNRPDRAWERVAWYEENPLQYGVLAALAAAFVSMLVLGPLVYGRMALVQHSSARLARWGAIAVALLNLLFVVVLVVMLDDPEQVAYGISPLLAGVLAIPLVTTSLVVGLLALAVGAWRGQYWRRGVLVHYSLFSLAAAVFVAWLAYWNLLGWRF